jgi:hypothetical protein
MVADWLGGWRSVMRTAPPSFIICGAADTEWMAEIRKHAAKTLAFLESCTPGYTTMRARPI